MSSAGVVQIPPPPLRRESASPQVSAPDSPSSGMVLNFHTGAPSSSLKAPIQPLTPNSEPDGPMITRSSKGSGLMDSASYFSALAAFTSHSNLPVPASRANIQPSCAPRTSLPSLMATPRFLIEPFASLPFGFQSCRHFTLQVAGSSANVEYSVVTYITPP